MLWLSPVKPSFFLTYLKYTSQGRLLLTCYKMSAYTKRIYRMTLKQKKGHSSMLDMSEDQRKRNTFHSENALVKCFPSALRHRNLKMQKATTIIGNSGLVFEENSGKEIT